MSDQCGRPQTHVIPRFPRTAADRLVDLCPLGWGESGGTSRDRLALHPLESTLIEGVYPAPNRVLVPIQPRRNLGTALHIHHQQHAVVPLAQPDVRCLAKGHRPLLPCRHGVRDRQHAQALPLLTFRAVIPQGLKNRNYVVGLL
jgi:hypothetical protein